jgi:flagellar motor protein MotB
MAILAAGLGGCQRPMFPTTSGQNPWWGAREGEASLYQRLPNGQVQYAVQEQSQQIDQLSKQMSDMNQQLSRFDTDNQGLHGQVAGLQQRLDTANTYIQQLKQQLRDATVQLQQSQQALAQTSPSGSQSAASYQLAGSATIRANNSLMGKLEQVRTAGVSATMDGDVIRVEFPSDQTFVPGTFQIQSAAQAQLNNLAATIRQQFPQQFIGIEAHWDQTPVTGPIRSIQQLTATQSLAIYDQLMQSGLPGVQLFTVGMGSARQRFAGNAPQNRRIEIVIYPETFATPR